MKKTVSLKDIKVKTTSHAEKIYPKVSFNNKGDEHKTIAIKLNREQAIELATNILLGAKEWESMHITAFRNVNSASITVTSQKIEDED
ncbi:hypothetical protein D3C71_1788860 [compost metagenome]